MVWRYVILAFVLELCLLSCESNSEKSCNKVRKRCQSRLGCGMAFHTSAIACDDVMSGLTTDCTQQCQRALVSLITSEDGAGLDFITCHCGSGGAEEIADCEEKKQRIQVCASDVLNAWKTVNDSSVVIPCTLALWLCEADSSCLTALKYFFNHCSSLVSGRKCSERCNNSVNILYQQKRAKKLQTCQCEGTEVGFDCYKVRKYTDILCYNKTVPYRLFSNKTNKASSIQLSVTVFGLAMSYSGLLLITKFLRLLQYHTRERHKI